MNGELKNKPSYKSNYCFYIRNSYILDELKHQKDKKGKEIYRLFCCSNCVSSKNKNGVCITRDKNSAISIMKLAKEWLNTQTRTEEFKLKHTPSHCITSVKARNEIRQSYGEIPYY